MKYSILEVNPEQMILTITNASESIIDALEAVDVEQSYVEFVTHSPAYNRIGDYDIIAIKGINARNCALAVEKIMREEGMTLVNAGAERSH